MNSMKLKTSCLKADCLCKNLRLIDDPEDIKNFAARVSLEVFDLLTLARAKKWQELDANRVLTVVMAVRRKFLKKRIEDLYADEDTPVDLTWIVHNDTFCASKAIEVLKNLTENHVVRFSETRV